MRVVQLVTLISFFDLKHFIYSCNGNAKYVVFYTDNIKNYKLIDTGATLSVVKREALPNNTPVHRDNTLINGIGGQKLSLGSVNLTLNIYEKQAFQNIFLIIDSLPLKADGILGLDFLTNYQANINLTTDILTLNNSGIKCELKLLNEHI